MMKNVMKKAICFMLVLSMLLSASACKVEPIGGGSEGDGLVKLKVAVMPQQLSLPIYYIKQQGWDVENGFELELVTFTSGAPMNEALGANLWDLATIGAAAVMSCSAFNAVHIASHEDSAGGLDFMIKADSAIAKVKGYNKDYPDVYGDPSSIKGTTFMLPIGGGHHLLLEEYLKIFGLTISDIRMVNMGHAESYQAFVAGQGDFSATAHPMTDKYINEGYISACSMNTMSVPYLDNLVANKKSFDVASKKEAMTSLMVQMLRCADLFAKDDELLLDAMMQWYEVNGQKVKRDEIVSQTLSRPFFTVADYESVDTTAGFKRTAEFFTSIGNITKDDLKRVLECIDDSVLKEAIKQYELKY